MECQGRLPYIKTYYTVMVIKTVQYWQKTGKLTNGIESRAQKYPHIYSQIIIDKMPRPFNEEMAVFSTNGVGKTYPSTKE